MRFYVIAMVRGSDGEYPVPMAKAIEGAGLFATHAEAEAERREVFDNDEDWEVRAVNVTMPRRSATRRK